MAPSLKIIKTEILPKRFISEDILRLNLNMFTWVCCSIDVINVFI